MRGRQPGSLLRYVQRGGAAPQKPRGAAGRRSRLLAALDGLRRRRRRLLRRCLHHLLRSAGRSGASGSVGGDRLARAVGWRRQRGSRTSAAASRDALMKDQTPVPTTLGPRCARSECSGCCHTQRCTSERVRPRRMQAAARSPRGRAAAGASGILGRRTLVGGADGVASAVCARGRGAWPGRDVSIASMVMIERWLRSTVQKRTERRFYGSVYRHCTDGSERV